MRESDIAKDLRHRRKASRQSEPDISGAGSPWVVTASVAWAAPGATAVARVRAVAPVPAAAAAAAAADAAAARVPALEAPAAVAAAAVAAAAAAAVGSSAPTTRRRKPRRKHPRRGSPPGAAARKAYYLRGIGRLIKSILTGRSDSTR
jgi:hypothetical protein